ncbi:MAG: hypothetical protein Q9199_006904 [Rusavskia elegans]
MDSSTAAAIAAVAIAVLAFVVAFAQVLHQYFVTGSLLRLCDSTVYGSLPGRGRRIWQANQFRFRVVYTLPQLRLERGFWEVDYHDGAELHEYPALNEWLEWKRPPPGLICAVYASVNKNMRRALRPMSWILRTTIRKTRRLVHRLMQTSVAQELLGRSSNLSHHRAYTEYHAFLSSLRQSIHSRMAKFMAPYVSSESRSGLASGIIPESQIDLFEPTGRRSGEASWASFTRAVQYSSRTSLRFEVAEGDADRCPSDLSNVPMHVSLRDVVVLGLMMGMRISSTHTDIEMGDFSMVGNAGYITCSKHPILGSILHFTPSNLDAMFGFLGGSPRIEKLWVLRLKGCVPIAGRAYDDRERDYLIELNQSGGLRMVMWREHNDAKGYNEGNTYPKKPNPRRGSVSSFVNLPASPSSIDSRNSKKLSNHTVDTSQEARLDIALRRASIPVHQPYVAAETEAKDGKPEDRSSMKRSPSPTTDEDRDALPESLMITPDFDPDSHIPRRHESGLAQDGDDASRALHSPSHASKERMELTRIETAKRSQPNVAQPDEQSVKNERSQFLPRTPPYKTTTFPSDPTQNRTASSEDYDERGKPGNAHQTSDHETTAPPGNPQGPTPPLPQRPPSSIEARQDAEYDESLRERIHEQRIQKQGIIGWRWLSQMDIIPGYWATPWLSYNPEQNMRFSRGAISAVLEALSGHLNTRNLQFVSEEHELRDFLQWASAGQSTWPIYAINARGGVVVQAHYAKVEFSGFTSSMAAVKLLHNYQWQTEEYTRLRSEVEVYKTAELMMLDSWLSICGRQPEIVNGKSSLLHDMPSLLQSLDSEFDLAFAELDRTASEGGLQHIQQVARSLVETLALKALSQAEQLFTLVAMLRTAKVEACVCTGPSTWKIDGILERDTRVWLV